MSNDITDWHDALDVWTDGQIKCRAWRSHPWDDYTVNYKSRQYLVVQVCTRCGLFRACIIDRKGEIIKPWKVDYRDTGYLIKGLGRMPHEVQIAIRVRAVGGLRVVKSRRQKRAS